MAKRVGAYHQVRIWDRYLPQAVPHGGRARKDTVQDMIRFKRGTCSYWIPADAGQAVLGSAQRPTVSAFKLGNDAAVAMATPVPDVAQAATLDASYYTTSGGNWQAFQASDYGQQVMFQDDGEAGFTVVRSGWNYGTDPVFCVAIWRPAWNTTSAAAAGATSGETRVGFGRRAYGEDIAGIDPEFSHQFALSIPYGGDGAKLYACNTFTSPLHYADGNPVWEEVPLLEGTSPLAAVDGVPDDGWLWLWVLVARGCIWVSTDGFASVAAGYAIPQTFLDADGVEREPWYGNRALAGPVTVTQSCGQVMATIYPIYMPTGAWLKGDVLDFPYKVSDNANTLNVCSWIDAVTSDPVSGSEPGATLADVTLTVESPDDYSRRWKAAWARYGWQTAVAGAGTVTTYACPLLYGVQIDQQANVVETGMTAVSQTVTDLKAIELNYPGVGKPSTGRLTFDNTAGVYSSLDDYQRVAVIAGSRLDTGSSNASLCFTGYIRTPGRGWQRGQAAEADVYVVDALTRADDLRAYGDEPDVSLFTLTEGVNWFAARCMMSASQVSGPTVTDLVAGDSLAEEGTWQPRIGQSYRQFLSQLVTRGAADNQGGALYMQYAEPPVWERLTWTSGPFATTSANYTLHELATPSYEASTNHVFGVQTDRRTSSDQEWANLVVVRGTAQTGAPVLAIAMDTDASSYNPASADFGGGWHHIRVENDASRRTEGECADAADAALARYGAEGEWATIVTDMQPGMRYGHVVTLSGPADGRLASAGVLNRKYRVEEFKHVLRRGRVPVTELVGRYIGEA